MQCLMKVVFHTLGRLHDPRNKMRIRLLAKQSLLSNRTYLFHDSRDAFLDKAYSVGVEFNAFLSRKYGLKKLQSFFYSYSTHYFTNLLFAYNYKKFFGNSLEDDLKAFNAYEFQMAAKMKFLKGKVLGESFFVKALGKYKNEVFFATNHFQRPVEIFSIDKITTKLSKRSQGAYDFGSIFKINDEFYINTAQQYNLKGHIAQGLFNKDLEFIQDSLKQYTIYYDKEDKFYFPVQDYGQKFHLYRNKKFLVTLDNVNVIIDKQKNFFYRKNDVYTKKISFYKNNKLLFSLNNINQSLQLSDADEHALYFIGPSQYGSTLFAFVFDEEKIYRLSQADNILNAVKVNQNTFLAFAAGLKSNQYILFKPNYIEQKSFGINKALKPLTANKLTAVKDAKNYEFTTKNYDPVSSLSYKKTSFLFGLDRALNLNITFTDPLYAHAVNAIYNSSKEISTQGLFYNTTGLIANINTGFFNISFAKDKRSSAKLSYLFDISRPLAKFGSHQVFSTYKTNLPLSHFKDKNTTKTNGLHALRLNYNFSESYPYDIMPSLSNSSTANLVLQDKNLSFGYRQDNSFGHHGHYLKTRLQASF